MKPVQIIHFNWIHQNEMDLSNIRINLQRFSLCFLSLKQANSNRAGIAQSTWSHSVWQWQHDRSTNACSQVCERE